MIHLSFDQDWAPAWATLDICETLEAARIAGTLFATHSCASLSKVGSSPYGLAELGLHPNFLPGSSQGDSPTEVLDTVGGWFPHARGVRAHGLVRSTCLWMEYGKRGLQYDSSDLLDGLAGIRPLRTWNGLFRLPIFWEDDVHLQHGRPCQLESVRLELSGLKIFNFHPVLVALNAGDLAGYQDLKRHLSVQGISLASASRTEFAPFINRDRPGMRDMLAEVIAYMQAHPDQAGGTLITILDQAGDV